MSAPDQEARKSIATRIGILVVSPLPPPFGGPQTWTETLRKRGLKFPFEVEVLDTKSARSPGETPKMQPSELARNLRILRMLHGSVTSGRFSLVHFNMALTATATVRNFCAARLATLAALPYVVHLHGTFAPWPRLGFGRSAMRWAWRTIFGNASGIVVLGKFESLRPFGDYGGKTVILPNFLDCEVIPHRLGRMGEHAGEERLNVLYTGSIIEAKGVFAILKIAERVPEAYFHLVGDGPEEACAELRRRIVERGLAHRVRLSGPVDHRRLLALLQEHDVFLFPSQAEAFPYSVAEAMAAGLPVVASSVGALPEMIDVPDGGFLAAPDDLDAHADALRELARSASLRRRMGDHNRRKAVRHYDYDVVTGELCDLYATILVGQSLSDDSARTSRISGPTRHRNRAGRRCAG